MRTLEDGDPETVLNWRTHAALPRDPHSALDNQNHTEISPGLLDPLA